MRRHCFLIAIVFALVATTDPSAQQKFQTLGPAKCTNCHDHDAEKLWYQKKEIPEVYRLFPDKGSNAGHINSLKQLETPKSNEYAQAIGLADKYDPAGACVACHGTVFSGDTNAGVSCESCHGPGSGYLDPHQKKDSYEPSVAQYGMTKLVGNLQGWTQQCTNCHVMNDERLIKANHPSGDDFDLGKKFQPVSLHFKKMYAQADVAAVARAEMDGIIRRRRGGASPQSAAVAAAPASAAPAARADVSPAAPPPASPVAPAPVAADAPAPSAPVTAPANAVSAAAPPVAAVVPSVPPPAVAPATVPGASAPRASTAPQAASPAAPAPPAPAAARSAAAITFAPDPPPGSPTSIEPAVSADPASPVQAAQAPAAAPIATVILRRSDSLFVWWLIGGAVIVAGFGILAWRRKRS